MNFFQRFIYAWRFAQLPSYDLEADKQGYWGDREATATLQFFNSETGHKLRVLLNNFVFKTCYQSCAAVGNHGYHAGIARGTSLSVFHLQELITRVPAQEDAEKDGEAAPFLPETYAA